MGMIAITGAAGMSALAAKKPPVEKPKPKDPVAKTEKPTVKSTELYVQLQQQADLRDLANLPVGTQRMSEAVARMRKVAGTEQDRALQGIRSQLDEAGLKGVDVDVADRLWLTNAMVVSLKGLDESLLAGNAEKGKPSSLKDLFASVKGIDSARPVDSLKFEIPSFDSMRAEGSAALADAADGAARAQTPWNLDMIGIDSARKAGLTGAGVTVANLDTGVDVTHPALWSKYRGHDPKKGYDHERNYFDAYAKPRKVGDKVPMPFDDSGHGTHTMGSMVGDDGFNGPIGVAPGAKFLAARGLQEKGGDMISLLKSMEYLVAPTDNWNQGDPGSGAHIVNHSWGGQGPDFDYTQALRNMAAAGMVNVVSAGNNGRTSDKQNLGDPGMWGDALTVGAIDKHGQVANFSSKGPSPVSDEYKPYVVAPGVDVNSSIPGGKQAAYSGTSMAAPHVSGVLALVDEALAKRNESFVDLDDAKFVMQHMTTDVGEKGPDDASGYGMVDLRKLDSALDALVKQRKNA